MTISVLVPVYNGADYLKRCLDGIWASVCRLQATAVQDVAVEIVVVDDASTDATASVLDGLAARVPCLSIVRHATNLGLGEARNTGVRHAAGDWIAWVDADDAVVPEWLPRLAENAAAAVDVVVFGARMWRGDRARAMRYRPDVCTVDATEFCCDALRDLGTSSWMWNKMFRRRLFEGVRFSGRCQEDFRALPCLLSRARSVRSIPDALYDYYRPAGSLSRHGDQSGSAQGLRDCFAIDWRTAGLPSAVQDAWQEGIVLRAADYLRNSGDEPLFRRYLRRNLHRVLFDPRQSLRQKVKCLIEAVR